MKQGDDLITRLCGQLDRAKRLRISCYRLDREAGLPVNLATLYRWRSRLVDPHHGRLNAALTAITAYLDREEASYARGANTRGGALTVNEEFFIVKRDGVKRKLQEPEFKLLDAMLRSRAKDATVMSWLQQDTGLKIQAIYKAVSTLRVKLRALDFSIEAVKDRVEAGGAYVLVDLFGSETDEAA